MQDIVEHCKNDPTATQCADLAQACRASTTQLQQCLDGLKGRSTYTQQNSDPKIQNPIAKGSLLFFFTPYEVSIANPQINLLWGSILAIVDILLVLTLMLNGLYVLMAGTTFRYAQAVENLPGVLLAIIAAHVSLAFILAMLSLGNSMTLGIYNFTQNNPAIHRSPSGFKNGGKTQDLYLHVLFPSYNEKMGSSFNGDPNLTPQEAAKQWGTPQTDQDIKQFQDLVCTWEWTNFDSNLRLQIFGPNGDYQNGGLYNLFKQRNDDLKKYDGSKVPDGVQTALDSILTGIDRDMQEFSSGSDRLAWYNDAFVGTPSQESWDKQMDDAWNQYGQDIPQAEKNRLGDDRYGRGGEGMLRANIHKLLQGVPPHEGDMLEYSCQHDATGNSFQLVPDDLNFKDLFKNLQDLISGVSVFSKLLALMLLGMMIVRLFFINLYIVTAPLGIACWALPGKIGQSVTRLWLQGFLSTVLVQFLMVVALIAIQVLLGNVLAFVGSDPNHPIGNLSNDTLSEIMRIACIWFVMRMPSLFGNAPMHIMSMAGEMLGQVAVTTVQGQIARAQMVMQAVTSAVGVVASFAR
ncbi:hypothetical protein KSD_66490 [Ktedonobacter sp. SOSP1-85]|uniref:hypothetical protein n=1 Tax=Ktedonobacter sp. SOSP1-85 TaxID=2778367 RepID=UPI001915E837|nr:hypothetical protein [Ktedonobacter sp. SOSP1-85]GHO78878.1 hypothetical protein KSD_66490 [Ktedonobacter sp. SOSP1-85]